MPCGDIRSLTESKNNFESIVRNHIEECGVCNTIIERSANNLLKILFDADQKEVSAVFK